MMRHMNNITAMLMKQQQDFELLFLAHYFELVFQVSHGVNPIGKCWWSPGSNNYRGPRVRYDRGTPLPDLNMPDLRQRCFPLLGNGSALANLALTGLLLYMFSFKNLLSNMRYMSAIYRK